MLDLFSRWVLHLELRMAPHPPEAPTLWFVNELEHLLSAYETGNAVQLIQNESAALRVRDIAVDRDQNLLHLLINYSDTNIGDPVFENLETGDLRIEPKLEGEGVAVSAHMAIDLTPSVVGQASYRAVLEDVPGVGRSKITPFLTYLYRNSHRIQWAAPDGSVRTCRPMFDIVGRMSDTLRNDLEEGKLSLIELVQYNVSGDQFDEEGEVTEEVRTIRLSVAPNIRGIEALNLLNRIKIRGKALDYPNMRVRWKSGRQKTIEFGTAREDAGDVLIFRTTEIRSETVRTQCDESLRPETKDQLSKILISERLKEP